MYTQGVPMNMQWVVCLLIKIDEIIWSFNNQLNKAMN